MQNKEFSKKKSNSYMKILRQKSNNKSSKSSQRGISVSDLHSNSNIPINNIKPSLTDIKTSKSPISNKPPRKKFSYMKMNESKFRERPKKQSTYLEILAKRSKSNQKKKTAQETKEKSSNFYYEENTNSISNSTQNKTENEKSSQVSQPHRFVKTEIVNIKEALNGQENVELGENILSDQSLNESIIDKIKNEIQQKEKIKKRVFLEKNQESEKNKSKSLDKNLKEIVQSFSQDQLKEIDILSKERNSEIKKENNLIEEKSNFEKKSIKSSKFKPNRSKSISQKSISLKRQKTISKEKSISSKIEQLSSKKVKKGKEIENLNQEIQVSKRENLNEKKLKIEEKSELIKIDQTLPKKKSQKIINKKSEDSHQNKETNEQKVQIQKNSLDKMDINKTIPIKEIQNLNLISNQTLPTKKNKSIDKKANFLNNKEKNFLENRKLTMDPPKNFSNKLFDEEEIQLNQSSFRNKSPSYATSLNHSRMKLQQIRQAFKNRKDKSKNKAKLIEETLIENKRQREESIQKINEEKMRKLEIQKKIAKEEREKERLKEIEKKKEFEKEKEIMREKEKERIKEKEKLKKQKQKQKKFNTQNLKVDKNGNYIIPKEIFEELTQKKSDAYFETQNKTNPQNQILAQNNFPSFKEIQKVSESKLEKKEESININNQDFSKSSPIQINKKSLSDLNIDPYVELRKSNNLSNSNNIINNVLYPKEEPSKESETNFVESITKDLEIPEIPRESIQNSIKREKKFLYSQKQNIKSKRPPIKKTDSPDLTPENNMMNTFTNRSGNPSKNGNMFNSQPIVLNNNFVNYNYYINDIHQNNFNNSSMNSKRRKSQRNIEGSFSRKNNNFNEEIKEKAIIAEKNKILISSKQNSFEDEKKLKAFERFGKQFGVSYNKMENEESKNSENFEDSQKEMNSVLHPKRNSNNGIPLKKNIDENVPLKKTTRKNTLKNKNNFIKRNIKSLRNAKKEEFDFDEKIFKTGEIKNADKEIHQTKKSKSQNNSKYVNNKFNSLKEKPKFNAHNVLRRLEKEKTKSNVPNKERVKSSMREKERIKSQIKDKPRVKSAIKEKNKTGLKEKMKNNAIGLNKSNLNEHKRSKSMLDHNQTNQTSRKEKMKKVFQNKTPQINKKSKFDSNTQDKKNEYIPKEKKTKKYILKSFKEKQKALLEEKKKKAEEIKQKKIEKEKKVQMKVTKLATSMIKKDPEYEKNRVDTKKNAVKLFKKDTEKTKKKPQSEKVLFSDLKDFLDAIADVEKNLKIIEIEDKNSRLKCQSYGGRTTKFNKSGNSFMTVNNKNIKKTKPVNNINKKSENQKPKEYNFTKRKFKLIF